VTANFRILESRKPGYKNNITIKYYTEYRVKNDLIILNKGFLNNCFYFWNCSLYIHVDFIVMSFIIY